MIGSWQVGIKIRCDARAAFIDLTIAIVIKAIAFTCGTTIFNWWHPVWWQVLDTQTKSVSYAVINLSVAVRVHVVACFFFRAYFAFAGFAPCAFDAALNTGFASNLRTAQFLRVAMRAAKADLAGLTWTVLINLHVAVVVHPIAAYFCRVRVDFAVCVIAIVGLGAVDAAKESILVNVSAICLSNVFCPHVSHVFFYWRWVILCCV